MKICPECSMELPGGDLPACAGCGWASRRVGAFDDYLTRAERTEELLETYRENYEQLAEMNLSQSNIDRRFLINQARRVLEYLGDVKGARACDVGIGQGFLSRLLLEGGVTCVTAVDVSPSYLAAIAAVENVTPVLANAERLPFREEFDVLVSTDVMEHVLNVGSFLFCVNRSLRIGGRVCIRVPYREPLLGYSPHRGYAHQFGHLRSFDKDILRLYMRESGFEVLKIHLDGFSLGTPQPVLYDRLWKKRMYNRFVSYVRRKIERETDVALWDSWYARWIMRPVEMAVVAIKVQSLD